MTFMQYLSTTVYRYYINQLINQATAIFTRRSAIQVQIDFRDPRTQTNGPFRDPRTGTGKNFRDPRTQTNGNFIMIQQVAP